MRIRELLKSRAVIVAVGCLAVTALMGASAVLVAAQEQESGQAAEARYQEHRTRAMEAMERALATARRGMELNRESLRRLLVQTLHSSAPLLQDQWRAIQERHPSRVRVRSMPRIEIRDGFGWRGRGSVDWILSQADELELSDAQKDQIRAASKAARRADIERDAAIEVAEMDLEDLMEDEYSADLGAVEAKMGEIAQLRVAGRVADLRLRQQVYGLLTADQRSELDDLHGNVLLWKSQGPGAFHFGRDGNEFFFGPEMLERFEFDEDFPFGVFEFRRKKDDGDQARDSDSATGKRDQGVSGLKTKGVKTF